VVFRRPPLGRYRLAPGEFYVLSDNRALSGRQPVLAAVPGSGIVGKVVLVWWHDDHPGFRRFRPWL